MERKRIAVVAAAAIVAMFLLFMLQPQVVVEEKYSVSFGSTVLVKEVLITNSIHTEEFAVNNGKDFALITIIPKNLAANASEIKKTDHFAELSLLEFDPILKFTQKGGEQFWANLEFNNVGEDICTVNILLPLSYIDSLNSTQLSELKEKLLEYGALQPTCAEAHDTEQQIANSLEEVFEEAELQKASIANAIYLQDNATLHSAVLGALTNVLAVVKANKQAGVKPDGTEPAEGETVVKITFEESAEKMKETYLTYLRDNYTLLKNKEAINLTISSKIPKSYYAAYLVYPDPLSNDSQPVLEFEKPKVEVKGINPDYFKIKISGDGQPYLLELEFTRGTNELLLEPLSGEIVFDYKEVWPSSPIKIPINIWGNPCKASIEEKATNFEIYGELLECYEAETRKAKMIYLANVQNKQKELDKRVQEISKSSKVIFISPTRLNDVLKRFKEGVNYSQIASGIEAGRATEFQDELEVAEHFWLSNERDDLEFAKTNYNLVSRAIGTEEFLCNYLAKEWMAMKDPDEIKRYKSVVGICQSFSAIAKDKFLVDKEMLNDPFSETNRKAYVKKTIKLQEIINQIEHANPCGLEKDCDAWRTKLEKDLFDNLDTQYGSNKELVTRIEGEVSDLQARIKYLEEIKPTWKGYLNPFVSLGAGLEAVGDIVFWEKEISLSREEYKEQIEEEIADIKGQIVAIKEVIVELKSGNSLVGMYSEIRKKFSGRGFKEERFIKSGSGDLIRTNRLLERWNAFYYNSTLRGELRKQRLLLGKDFLENIDEANLLYSTIHSLEMERDSVLAFEILLDAENYARVNGKKSWREANLVNTIKRVVEIEQGKVEKTDTITFSLSQERKGIRKILEQVREGIPLIDVFEVNWDKGPNYTLNLGIPKVIDSELTLLLREWDSEAEEWAIEAFVEGFEAGISSVSTGDSVGFIGAPGLVVKAANGNKNQVDVSLFVDNDYKKYFPKPNIEGLYSERVQGLTGGKKYSIYETVYDDVLLYVGIESVQISVPYPSSDKIDIVEVTVWLFEKSELSKEDAENLITPGFTKIREIGETHKFQMFYQIGANGSRRLDAETITGSHGIGADSHVKLYAAKNNNIYASKKFPGLAFKFEWYPETKGLAFYNHYSDIVKLAKSVKEEKPKAENNDKVTEAKKDLLISKGLNNISIYTQIQVRKMLLEDKKVSDEKLAPLLFMTAKRYERFSLWQEAISVYTQINDAFPSTAQGKLAIAQRDKVEEQVTAEKFVAFAEGLTSLESAVQYVLITGVVKVIGRVVQLTRVARVANVAKAQPAAQASEVLATSAKLLPGATSKFSKVKAFFNYPLEDLIARPIAKGINVYRGWKAAKTFKSAQQITAELKALGITWKPTATEISAAWSSPGTKVAEKGLTVWGSGDDLLYFHSEIGSVSISSNPQLLSKALPKLEKFAKSTAYLEKVKNVPEVIKALEKIGIRWTNSNTAMYARIARDIVKDATTRVASGTVPSPPETTALVIRDHTHAIEVMNQSLAPFALTETAKDTTTIIPLIERIAGKTGVTVSASYATPAKEVVNALPVFYGSVDATGVPTFVMKESTTFGGTRVLFFETPQGHSFYIQPPEGVADIIGLDVEGIFQGRYYPHIADPVDRFKMISSHELTHKWLAGTSEAQKDAIFDAFVNNMVIDEKTAVLANLSPDQYLIKGSSTDLDFLKVMTPDFNPTALKTGELERVHGVTSGWGITIVKKTAEGNFIDITKILSELMAEHAAFGGYQGAKIPNEALKAMRDAGFFGVDFDVAMREILEHATKMPKYAKHFVPANNLVLNSPGKIPVTGGSTQVNIPKVKNFDKILLDFKPVSGSSSFVEMQTGKTVRVSISQATTQKITKITVGSGKGTLKGVRMPTLEGKAVTVGSSEAGMQVHGFPMDSINKAWISVPPEGLPKGIGVRATYMKYQGAENVLLIEVSDMGKTVVLGAI